LLPAKAQPFCPAQLDQAIAPIINAPQFRRAHWGILVQTGNNQTLYSQNAEEFFTPASNAKLLTTAAVLTRLGSQFRIRTSVYQMGHATLNILRVVGRGDPSLTDLQLQDLAQQIRDRGITQIDRLVLDDQYFRGDAINPTWEWEDIQAGYGAVANSLIINQNAIGLTLVPQRLGEPLQVVWDEPSMERHWQINNRSKTVAIDQPEFLQVGRTSDPPTLKVEGQLRVGSAVEPIAISVPQPTAYFADRFQQALDAAGIQVKQIQTLDSSDAQAIQSVRLTQAIEIAAVESAPLAELLIEANQESNNLYAEAALRLLGANQMSQSSSSLEAGLDEVEAALTQIGVNPENYRLSDGSGLSRRNLVSPTALVETLQTMQRSPYASNYQNSLAVAGVSGTLRNRFQGTSVQGRLQGKTGFLSGAAALSGYLQPPHYPLVTFSIMVNQFDLPIGEVQEAIDRIVETLQSLQPC
jgi:D-alanyl-D-alanine carboxypeptidase/D-alanyl-D-alanine-endopeptidase (penicillin-binding protein 4)